MLTLDKQMKQGNCLRRIDHCQRGRMFSFRLKTDRISWKHGRFRAVQRLFWWRSDASYQRLFRGTFCSRRIRPLTKPDDAESQPCLQWNCPPGGIKITLASVLWLSGHGKSWWNVHRADSILSLLLTLTLTMSFDLSIVRVLPSRVLHTRKLRMSLAATVYGTLKRMT